MSVTITMDRAMKEYRAVYQRYLQRREEGNVQLSCEAFGMSKVWRKLYMESGGKIAEIIRAKEEIRKLFTRNK